MQPSLWGGCDTTSEAGASPCRRLRWIHRHCDGENLSERNVELLLVLVGQVVLEQHDIPRLQQRLETLGRLREGIDRDDLGAPPSCRSRGYRVAVHRRYDDNRVCDRTGTLPEGLVRPMLEIAQLDHPRRHHDLAARRDRIEHL